MQPDRYAKRSMKRLEEALELAQHSHFFLHMRGFRLRLSASSFPLTVLRQTKPDVGRLYSSFALKKVSLLARNYCTMSEHTPSVSVVSSKDGSSRSLNLTNHRGSYSIPLPIYALGPMVDQSELAFRQLCTKYGTNLCYSPMYKSPQFVDDPEVGIFG